MYLYTQACFLLHNVIAIKETWTKKWRCEAEETNSDLIVSECLISYASLLLLLIVSVNDLIKLLTNCLACRTLHWIWCSNNIIDIWYAFWEQYFLNILMMLLTLEYYKYIFKDYVIYIYCEYKNMVRRMLYLLNILKTLQITVSHNVFRTWICLHYYKWPFDFWSMHVLILCNIKHCSWGKLV